MRHRETKTFQSPESPWIRAYDGGAANLGIWCAFLLLFIAAVMIFGACVVSCAEQTSRTQSRHNKSSSVVVAGAGCESPAPALNLWSGGVESHERSNPVLDTAVGLMARRHAQETREYGSDSASGSAGYKQPQMPHPWIERPLSELVTLRINTRAGVASGPLHHFAVRFGGGCWSLTWPCLPSALPVGAEATFIAQHSQTLRGEAGGSRPSPRVASETFSPLARHTADPA